MCRNSEREALTTDATPPDNNPLQPDERRISVPAYRSVTLAPLAAERQAVRPAVGSGHRGMFIAHPVAADYERDADSHD